MLFLYKKNCVFVVFIIYYVNSSQKLYGVAEQPYNHKVNQELILNLVQSLEFTSYYDWKYILQDGRPRTLTMYRWWCARVLVFHIFLCIGILAVQTKLIHTITCECVLYWNCCCCWYVHCGTVLPIDSLGSLVHLVRTRVKCFFFLLFFSLDI